MNSCYYEYFQILYIITKPDLNVIYCLYTFVILNIVVLIT